MFISAQDFRKWILSQVFLNHSNVAQSRQHYLMQLQAPSFFQSTVLFVWLLCFLFIMLSATLVCRQCLSNALTIILIFCSKLQWASEYFNSLVVFLLLVGMLGVRSQRQIPFQVLCCSVQKNGRPKNEALTTPKEKVHKIHKL